MVFTAGFLGGCASLELEGGQAAAWDRFHACQQETNAVTVRLGRIEPSGRLHYSGQRIDLNKMRECLAQKREAR